MSKSIKSVFVYFLFLVFACPSVAKQTRFVEIQLKDKDGAHEVTLYRRSYALVIGIDQYMDPAWPVLSNAINDAKAIANELEKHGFSVQLNTNLNSKQLKKTIEEFVIRKGRHPEARLFIWYAGHGHTIEGEGFLVPSDASSPFGADGWKFRLKALSLRRFGEFMRQARAKHVMTIFDSCFSGTVFNTARSKPPPAITKATTRKVRQFVASGEARQVVSDNGLFRKLFLDAISGRDARADMNGDGYVIGSELGLFLHQRVSNLTENRQTPRSGKLNAYGFDLGDFVFRTTKESRRLVEEKKKNAIELAYWQSVTKQDTSQAYRVYVQKYPEGSFTGLAQLKLKDYARIDESRARQMYELEVARNKLADAEEKRRKREAEKRRKELSDLRLKQTVERERWQQQRKNLANRLKTMEKIAKKRAKEVDVVHSSPKEMPKTIIVANLPGQPSARLSSRELTLTAQKHLTRFGCYNGRIDGDWGARSRRAMQRFNKYSHLYLSTSPPDPSVINRMKKIKRRICPQIGGKERDRKKIKKKRIVTNRVVNRRKRKPVTKKRSCQTFPQCMAICNRVQRSRCGEKCSRKSC